MVNKLASYFNPVLRPNGKWYRPHKAAVATILDSAQTGDPGAVLVIRCDDYEKARILAESEVQAWDGNCTVSNPRFGWWRCGIRDNEPYWEHDEVRGAPGYVFDITSKVS